MKSTYPNTEDEIEVLDLKDVPWGRVRIREHHAKCSIFLTPDQLEEHARECLALAASIRERR
jgi:hypothetical protein